MWISQRRQQQAIADLAGGLTPGLKREHLPPLYQWLWDQLQGQSRYEAQQILYRMQKQSRGDDDDLADAIESILGMEAGQNPTYELLSQIGQDLRPVSWFWENWIPYGHITALVGWPGIGKSYVALNLAYLLEKALTAPNGHPFNVRNRRIIFVDAEDMIGPLYQRARAWGMEGNTFYVLRDEDDMINLSKQKHKDQLVDMCYDIKPDLIIIDSFSMISEGEDQSVGDVRPIMTFLKRVAQRFNCAELVIFHPRKPKDITRPITMFDLRGSSHILFVVRSIIGLELRPQAEPDPNGPRLLRVLKSNFGLHPYPITVNFDPINNEVARLSYASNTDFTPAIEDNEVDRCGLWLLEWLEEHGEKPARSVVKAATDSGFSESTLFRAREKVGERVIDTVGPRRKGNKWALAE